MNYTKILFAVIVLPMVVTAATIQATPFGWAVYGLILLSLILIFGIDKVKEVFKLLNEDHPKDDNNDCTQ